MKGFKILVQRKPDDLPFESAPLFELNVKSLDAASALLHMIAQTCADESEIISIRLYNLDEEHETEK